MMISRAELRRALYLGAAGVRTVADLGLSTTGLVIANTVALGMESIAREARRKRSIKHVLPGTLTGCETFSDGATFFFENANLEVRFITGQIVRITWVPGLLPVAYGPREGWPPAEPSGVEVVCASTEDGGLRLSSKRLFCQVSSRGAVSFGMKPSSLLEDERTGTAGTCVPAASISPSPVFPAGNSASAVKSSPSDEYERVLRRDLPPSRVGEGWELAYMLCRGEIVCGLGEKSSSVNLRNKAGTAGRVGSNGTRSNSSTRGKRYRLWNRDPGGLWGPGVDPLYMSIPFTISMGPGESGMPGVCTGCYYENSWESTFLLPRDISTAAARTGAPSLPLSSNGGAGGTSRGTSHGAGIHSTDMYGNEQLARIKFAGGALRYYLTAGSPAEVLERYTDMTGRPSLPPRWALGYHQSRWGYKTDQQVRSIAEGFESMEIPLSAIHLDIDYMDGYKVFTIDRERFPDMSSLCEELGRQGVRVVTILDPAVKIAAGYDMYEEGLSGGHFCKNAAGRVQEGVVWPGKAAFPDFTSEATRAWWSSKYELFASDGIGGVWHDMNEPTNISLLGDKTLPRSTVHNMEGRGGDHREAHNLYALQMNRAGYDGLKRAAPHRRPFIISRSGWAGSQRYAWGWTGDTASTWDALRQQIPTMIGLGMSGFPFSGSDTGGFNGVPDAELYLRWLQMGVFMPLFRTHSVVGVPMREPWRLPEAIQPAVAGCIRFRYRLLPYLYTLAHEASKTGMPLVRSLGNMGFDQGQDQDQDQGLLLWGVDDAFMLGGALLVAPITLPSCRSRTVRLPRGWWSSLWGDIGCPAHIIGSHAGNYECPGNPGEHEARSHVGSSRSHDDQNAYSAVAGDTSGVGPVGPVGPPVPVLAADTAISRIRRESSPLLGGRVVRLPGGLEEIPVLVRHGSVIPLDDAWAGSHPGPLDPSHRPELLSFHIWPDEAGNAYGVCYDDDGDGYGESRLDRLKFSTEADAATVTWEREGSYVLPERVGIVLHGMDAGGASVDGRTIDWDGTKVICPPFSSMRIENIRRTSASMVTCFPVPTA